MPKSLPSAMTLIKDSWMLFIKTWNDTVKISIWFLFFGLTQIGAAFIARMSPAFGNGVLLLVHIGVPVVSIWVSIRLIRAVLALDAGTKLDLSTAESTRAWQTVLPLALVAILQSLILIGGFILLVIPGIYLGVALSFAQIILIDQGLRGTAAIAASYTLVRGRWWATFWRQVATGFVFGVGVAIIIAALMVGFASLTGSFAAREHSDPLVARTIALLQSIVQAAVFPLFIIVQIKIYRALERSRE